MWKHITINLQFFASFLQVTSFECRKESSPGMWANYGITCSLNMRLEKQETQSYQDRAGGIPRNLNLSGLEHSISSEVRICDNLEQVR